MQSIIGNGLQTRRQLLISGTCKEIKRSATMKNRHVPRHVSLLTARRFLSLVIMLALAIGSVGAKATGGRESVTPQEMKEWLTYLASDELEGRNTFSEGLGLAAAYIADHLKSWGVKPGVDGGSYFQRVRVLGVKSTNNPTVTGQAARQTRTYKNAEGVMHPPNAGRQ